MRLTREFVVSRNGRDIAADAVSATGKLISLSPVV